MVFYRKYRPQTIEDLDSKEIREKLTSVLSSGNVHALLFTGPKGLGKTSTARIVAKVLNCEKRQLTFNNSQLTEKEKNSQQLKVNSKLLDLEPCNKCDQCVSITKGSNIDILEIDGASNRGIDEIRDLREKVKLSPARARKKVYIIDEVHMLTTEAFNALLKTLEEPPDHVVFILCTTEPHKVPATISSRCFHIAFKKATDEELVRAFSRIVKSEKIEADNEALFEIAKFSDGSFRDGVKILEELAQSAGNKKITKESVESLYQTSGINKNIEDMVGYFIEKDMKKGIGLIKDIVHSGTDLNFFMQKLISYLHEMLLAKTGVTEKPNKFSEKIELNELIKLIELLGDAVGKMKYSVLPQLPLEIAIVEWSAGENKDIKKVTEVASDPKSEIKKDADIKSIINSSSNENSILLELIDKIKVNNQQVAGFLRGCSVSKYEKDNLILESKFQFHKDKLEDPKAIVLIKNTLTEITGEDTSISFVLKS